MLDMKFLRENPDLVKENIKKKFQEEKLPLVDEVIRLDAENRAAITEASELRAKRNALSKANGPLFGRLKKASDEEKPAIQAQIDANMAAVKANDARLAECEKLEAEYEEKIRVSVAVLDGYARQFLDLVNVERHKLGLSAIVWDETICDVARNHSGDMAKNNGYSHTGSDGTSPESRLRAAGYENFYQIEIIARAFPNALTAFSAHLGNAQYRAVLRAGYTTMGAGAAYNPQSDGILYYTQVFYAAK